MRPHEPASTGPIDFDALRSALEAAADPDRVKPMQNYMRDQFTCMGLSSPARRAAQRPTLMAAKQASGAELIAFADRCWDQPEREFCYVAADVLRKYVANLKPQNLEDLERYISTNSWWDTVDALAAWSVGPLVKANPELGAAMDQWIHSDNIWIARTAILHQLGYKDDTDADRLFHYCLVQIDHTDFFIRKAIGWALRQYARQDPEAVRRFVTANEDRLSGLSKREALKHLGLQDG